MYRYPGHCYTDSNKNWWDKTLLVCAKFTTELIRCLYQKLPLVWCYH